MNMERMTSSKLMDIYNREEINYCSLFEYSPWKINVNSIAWVIRISSSLALHESSKKCTYKTFFKIPFGMFSKIT